MQKRQVVLKINTSGSSILNGDRIVEIDCVELINGDFTGKRFQRYINPNRIIESSAFKQHGLSYHFLRKHPMFGGIARDFFEFIFDAELLIEHGSNTVSYINREFEILAWQPLETYCQITFVSHPIHATVHKLVQSLPQAGEACSWC
jgi:DNA polymerase-3 subunit epsilon